MSRLASSSAIPSMPMVYARLQKSARRPVSGCTRTSGWAWVAIASSEAMIAIERPVSRSPYWPCFE